MTNSYNDMQNSKARCTSARTPPRRTRCRMLHMLHAKENGCKMIVVDPRFTRTAAKADQYVRIRSGTRHPVPVRHAVPHLQERLGRQEVHRRPRLRHGQGARRTCWPSGRPTRCRKPAASTRRSCYKAAKTMAENRPTHARVVHGPDAALDRQRDGARLVHRAARARQRRRVAAAAPTSSAATTTCRARPTSARTPIRCPATTASPKARGSTSPRSGASTTSGSRSSSRPGMMSKPGMTVSRWIDGVLEKNELIDQDSQPARRSFFWGHAPNSQTPRRSR